jgi:hypothetical protein
MDSGWWFHPSQVFTDTERIDLSNDPRWETTSHSSTRRLVADGTDGRTKWATAKWDTVRRVLVKRGQHSRHLG